MTEFLNRLSTANKMRQSVWDPESRITPLFRAVEMGGECGETLNIIKKLERERLGIKGSRTTIDRLGEEIADIAIVASLICNDYGIDLEQAIKNKFNQTSEEQGFDIFLE